MVSDVMPSDIMMSTIRFSAFILSVIMLSVLAQSLIFCVPNDGQNWNASIKFEFKTFNFYFRSFSTQLKILDPTKFYLVREKHRF